MSIPNYQLIKEAEWYYLARKRFVLTNFINAVALNSALVELTQAEHSIPPAPPPFTVSPRGEKSCSPGTKNTTGDSTDEIKHIKNVSPLILNAKEKVFDIGCEIIGRSSPVTVKPSKFDGQTDGSAEKKKDERKSADRKPGVFVEGINFESGTSVLNRRKSKELVLKMKRASSDSLESFGLRKSNDRNETDAGTVKVEAKRLSDPVEGASVDADQIKNQQLDLHQKAADKKLTSEADSSLDKPVDEGSEREIKRSIERPESKHSEGSPVVVSQTDGTHSSPLVTDVSIQLTKTDGRSECYRAPSDGKLELGADNSFDSEDPENEGILKRCSSFAGFRSDTACGTMKAEDESLSQVHSPVKGIHPILAGPVGRLRHFSAPLSGQGTPKSRVSTLPQTPSWVSSRGSFTEDGKSLLERNLHIEITTRSL